MIRKYITGWFSPTDLDVMVQFYRLEAESSPIEFEAEVLRSGGIAETLRGTDLGRLQSAVLAKYTRGPGYAVTRQARMHVGG